MILTKIMCVILVVFGVIEYVNFEKEEDDLTALEHKMNALFCMTLLLIDMLSLAIR